VEEKESEYRTRFAIPMKPPASAIWWRYRTQGTPASVLSGPSGL
jgi:hypothetical protein